MKSQYDKVKKLDLSKWIVTNFYHYTSSVRDRIATFEESASVTGKNLGDTYLKDLFFHFLDIVDTYYCIYKGEDRWPVSLNDNKITIEITNIETKKKLYLGKYDWYFSMGESVWSEFGYHTSVGIHSGATKN